MQLQTVFQQMRMRLKTRVAKEFHPKKGRWVLILISPCPEWLHVDASVVQKNVKVLKNGNHQHPVKLGKLKVSVHLMLLFRAYVVLFVTAFLLKRLLAATGVTTNFSSWWKQSVWPNRRTHRGQHCWGKSSNLYTWPHQIVHQIDAQCHSQSVNQYCDWENHDESSKCLFDETMFLTVLQSKHTSNRWSSTYVYQHYCPADPWNGSS